MTLGFAAGAANTALDSLITAYPWVKLHVGDPGGAGTANAATETTRKNPSFAAASGASKASSADAVWTSVAGSEHYTHFSLWSASTAGTFGGSGTVTASSVTAGDTFTIPTGSLTLTLPVAA
jgi:hypothetical protein